MITEKTMIVAPVEMNEELFAQAASGSCCLSDGFLQW